MAVKKKTKKKPITTIEMEIAVARHFGIRQHIIVPNISWGLSGMHEIDLFIIKKSGVAVEVEIKRSKSDFLADFKKDHKHIDRFNRISEFYYAFPIELLDKCIKLIPEHAGIIVCERQKNYVGVEILKAWVKREPKKIKGARKLTSEEQFKIARLGCLRIIPLKEKLLAFQNKL